MNEGQKNTSGGSANGAASGTSSASQNLILGAERREKTTKGALNLLRHAGRVPAVIYGEGQDNITISLAQIDLAKNLAGGKFFSTIFELNITDGGRETVLPRDVQFHPVKDTVIHVDFLRVGQDSEITVSVPVRFFNEDQSMGLRRGGILNIVRHEIEVFCRPDAIPGAIDIDLTGLEIGDSVHISAIALPSGVSPSITDRDFTVATIAAARAALADEEAEDEAAETEAEEEDEDKDAAGDKDES